MTSPLCLLFIPPSLNSCFPSPSPPFLYFNNYQFSFPVILCFLLFPEFFFCFFSHLWRPPTHLFKKALSHPCFVKLCDAHLYLPWLSPDFPYSPTSQPPLARLFTNAQVAEKFKQTFLKWRSWPQISVQVLVASKGGLSGMWWENMSFSINKCYCMDANHIKIHTPTRPNSLIQTIFFGRVTLALRTSLLNHRDHQSSSDIGKRFNITTTQRKSHNNAEEKWIIRDMNPVAVSQKHLLPSVPPIIGLRGGVCCKKHVWRDPLTIIGHFFARDQHHHPHVMGPQHTFILKSSNQDVLNLSKDRSPDESGQGIAPPFYCKLRGIQRDQFRTTLHWCLAGWVALPLLPW